MRNDERCTATAKGTGVRCRRRRHPGAAVCVKHGAGAPQVQRAASERIAALVDPALRAMARSLKSRDMGAVVRAATDILNRAGVRPDTFTGGEVRQMLRGVADIILRTVTDPAELASISREMKMLLSRNGDREGAASIPVAPWPAPTRTLPATPRHVTEMEIL